MVVAFTELRKPGKSKISGRNTVLFGHVLSQSPNARVSGRQLGRSPAGVSVRDSCHGGQLSPREFRPFTFEHLLAKLSTPASNL